MKQYLDGAPPGWWMMANTTHVLIITMGNGHLRNAINLVKRKGLTWHPKYKQLIAETVRRGWSNDLMQEDFLLDGAL